MHPAATLSLQEVGQEGIEGRLEMFECLLGALTFKARELSHEERL